MSLKNKTIKDFVNYLSADFFVKGFMFLSLPLLSRLMSPEEYGRMSLFVSATSILFVFFSLNVQNAISNRLMRTRDDFSSYLFSCLATVIPIQFIISIFIFMQARTMSTYFGLTILEFRFVVLVCWLLFFFNLYSLYLQAIRDSGAFSKLSISTKCIEVVLIFVFCYFFLVANKHYSKIYAQVIVLFPVSIYIIYKLWLLVEVKYKISHVKSAFLFAIPLIPHVVTNSMLAQVDRLLINKFLGPSDTGVYSFAYNISICIVVFIMAWNSSWQPKLYKLIETGSQVEAKKVILKSTCYLLLVTVGLMVFSYEISNIISANDYANSSKVLLLLIMGNSLIHVYLSYANYIFYSKKTIFISISTTVSLVLNIALNYFWIPFFGIEGAAWATVLSYATLCVLNYIFSVKYLKLSNLSLLVFIGFFCSILVTYLVCEFSLEFTTINSIVIRTSWLALICCVLIYLVKKLERRVSERNN
ncbi:lipopolysaccharide biosynthesis protein [Vibrio parahaemolyticus]|uniref:lipopolysaccharide biosynthesis protein n=1 Tax=Vibrio parahaemolyticus TaxID=670 RepID=UPI001D274B65|nr:oligosaccharide flippase family protein [Vibrio parahaemolyticus]EGR3134259.1 hypothetical protein [Vibrio parahaemolyticus]EJG1504247.1 oligosaccharide flippase family protein [Vibrio parahaemolyticus]MCS0067374.1 oligosaccharide flippase family protein [Vibrio parahaemolyticus]